MRVQSTSVRTGIASASSQSASGAHLARALRRVQDAVAQAGLVETLAPFGVYAAAARPATDALLQCYAIASAAQARFSEAEHIVIRALDLETAFSSAWWASLITAVARASIPQTTAQEVSELCTRLRLLTHNLDRLAPLLGGETDADAGAGHAACLQMRLSNNDGTPPALQRVAATIEAVDLLATAVAELHGSVDTLQLAAVHPDGGLEFRSSEPMIRSMNALVITIGEHMGAYGNARPRERAAAIAPLLPIANQIANRRDAARLHSLVETGVERLLVAGWSVSAPPSPALHRAADPAADDAANLPADLASLIAEERRQLSVSAREPRRLWRQADRPSHFGTPTSFDARVD